jgi:hypothetical protein
MDMIAFYKKGVTNLKLFDKIHKASADNIADLMARVDKLVDTQDAVVHDFKGDKADDALAVIWTSLGPLPRWVPGPTNRWAPGITRLVPHGT